MTNPIPLPTPDPMPLPGPVWLMMTLLLVTFLLHLLAMNLTVGGTAIAIVCGVRRKKNAFAGQLFDAAIRVLPVSLAFTVTLGVAALLFVQVLYGNFLYTSSILIGVFWIAVIPALIIAYYSLYYSKAHPEQTGTLYLALALMLAIGFIYINNFTLMLSPDRWLELYHRSTAGMNLNWSEATLVPRYLHFMLGAFAIAGLAVFATGIAKRSTEYGQWLMAQGSHWFVASTVVNYLVGMWFMMALPRSVLMDLFAGSALAASLDRLRHAAASGRRDAHDPGGAHSQGCAARATSRRYHSAYPGGDGCGAAGGAKCLSSALCQYPRNACQSTVERHCVISAAVRSWTDHGVLDARADLDFDGYGPCGLAGSGRLAKARPSGSFNFPSPPGEIFAASGKFVIQARRPEP